MMAHQQVLSVPSDLLVCLMTFMRLKIIMKVTSVINPDCLNVR